jgi:hypothetical protein
MRHTSASPDVGRVWDRNANRGRDLREQRSAKNWNRLPEVIQKLEAARAEGLQITARHFESYRDLTTTDPSEANFHRLHLTCR